MRRRHRWSGRLGRSGCGLRRAHHFRGGQDPAGVSGSSLLSAIQVQRTYAKPGRYSEILKATDNRGHVAYDFAIVDVVERGRTNKPSPAMHAAYFPSLKIRPGDPVTFVVRTAATIPSGETWDFGDGS